MTSETTPPTHEDIRALLGRLHTALAARDVTRWGVTTDGSARSPEPLAEVCGALPHHSGALHVVKAVVKAVGRAAARVRERLAATQPQWPTGHPRTQAAQAAARKKKERSAQRLNCSYTE